MERLSCGLTAIKINFETNGLLDICLELINKNSLKNGFVRIAITRGEGSRGYLPNLKTVPTLVIETIENTPDIPAPIDLWLSTYQKIPPACLPAAKTMQGLNSTLARMEAAENNCFESLQLDGKGNICECSSGNIFWFKENKLFTPKLKLGILPGTMRDAVIRLSPSKVVQGAFKLEELNTAEEVFITNVAWLAVGVKRLYTSDGKMNWQKFAVSEQMKQLILGDIGKQ
jgi:branched-subunit amino acid aminotransferase/4-amino-4-deoxychorismate lyase